jgi:dTDP-4-amino-4,6-dideoxy-D-galactose acyltransferase
MSTQELCQLLDWDSDFFGRRIARVIPGRLTAQTAEQAIAWSRAQGVECLYLLAESDDAETVRLAENRGFRLVDIRVTLECPMTGMPDTPASAAVRPSELYDVPALRAIARTSYRDSRFYYDPQFSTAMVDAFYETWIENSCLGYADQVLVADVQGQVAGFITCHLEETLGKIGLVGVSEFAQGQGVGRALVEAALHWFAGQGAALVTVVTQGRNIRAQRLYQRGGFVTRSVDLWYHRWFLPEESN